MSEKTTDPYFSDEPSILRSLITKAHENVEKWRTMFYEQQASHTVATGILSAQVRKAEGERDHYLAAFGSARRSEREYEKFCEKLFAALNVASCDEALSALSKGSRWIPAEQLPDGGRFVLVANKNEPVVGYYSQATGRWATHPGMWPIVGVTHWQPLPEAP